jgi:hypothetical protein
MYAQDRHSAMPVHDAHKTGRNVLRPSKVRMPVMMLPGPAGGKRAVHEIVADTDYRNRGTQRWDRRSKVILSGQRQWGGLPIMPAGHADSVTGTQRWDCRLKVI